MLFWMEEITTTLVSAERTCSGQEADTAARAWHKRVGGGGEFT